MRSAFRLDAINLRLFDIHITKRHYMPDQIKAVRCRHFCFSEMIASPLQSFENSMVMSHLSCTPILSMYMSVFGIHLSM